MNKTKLKNYLLKKSTNKNTYFWGASLFLKRILKDINLPKCQIKGIIDINPAKSGQNMLGYKIFPLSEIDNLKPELIIATANNYPNIVNEIKKLLEEKNINCEVFSLDLSIKAANVNFNLLKYIIKFKNSDKLKYIIRTANNYTFYNSTLKGMLCQEEKHMLHLLAKYYYSGQGAIFDAGIFLGGCTEALINGLSENKRIKPNYQIWAYEYGNCSPDENLEVDSSYTFEYLKGCYPNREITYDFKNIVNENLISLNKPNYYKLYLGDIIQNPYPEKIEIMFLDVCKCQKTNFAMQKLFNRLIPGKSIVIQQDYIYGICPWLKVTMGYLKDYFEFVGCTRINSAVFLLKKEIPAEVLNINPYETFEYETLEKMHNYYNKYLTKNQVNLVLKALDIMKKDKNVKI